MPTSYTSLLGLALPVTGELSGTWGDTVNNYITSYVDAAVAGAQTISGSQTAVTLSVTNGTSLSQAGSGSTGSAQYQIINCTGNPGSALTVTVPSASKVYLVLNNTSTSQTVTVKGAATTGVTVAAARCALIAWNGTDFELVATDDASKLNGTLAVANGGTGRTSLTANNVILGNGTSAVQFVAPGTSGNVLTSNGTTWTSAAAAATLLGQTDSASPFETSLGFEAGNSTTGVNNTFVGYQAGKANTSATNNTAIGFRALDVATTGGSNTAAGSNALGAVTTGTDNIGIGSSAAQFITTGIGNVAIGNNTIAGVITQSGNTAIGHRAAQLGNPTQVTAVGYRAAENIGLAHANNTAVGYEALASIQTGGDNAVFGHNSGDQITTGSQNTVVGASAGSSGTNDLTTGSNNIIIGYNAAASSATVSNEVTIGNTSITSTRLRGMVQLNAAMFEQATVSATAATGTINFDARTQSVLYYTTNASANWTLNVRGASGVSLDSVMATGQSITLAFLVTNGATAYYQTALQVDGSAITPKWQGGTAPTAGNASSIDAYVVTIIKTGAATFTALESQTRFA